MDHLPLTMMDAALVTQTMRGRPMTTHHVLEIGQELSRPSLEKALEALAAAHPGLRARTVERTFGWERTVEPFDPARARAQLTFTTQPAAIEDTAWISTPIDLAAEWPFRVRFGPTPRGAFTICFTLHHSVTDGHGALLLFDQLLDAALAVEARLPVPTLQTWGQAQPSPWSVIAAQGPRFLGALAAQTGKSLTRFWQKRADLHDAPDAAVDRFGVKVVPLPAAAWRALKQRATQLDCTRNDLLCAAAVRAAAEVRRERGQDAAPLRIVGGVDLRKFFGAEAPQSNWVGTLEADVAPEELNQPGLERLLHDRLKAAREPVPALVTPVLLGMLGTALPTKLFRHVFKSSDAPGGSHPYTLLVSHIRPPGKLCWPVALSPQSLWCASTLPRKPGVGLTITTVGEHVTIAACWPKPLVREETIDALLSHMQRDLGEAAAEASAARMSA
jgi:hypothetical protein